MSMIGITSGLMIGSLLVNPNNLLIQPGETFKLFFPGRSPNGSFSLLLLEPEAYTELKLMPPTKPTRPSTKCSSRAFRC